VILIIEKIPADKNRDQLGASDHRRSSLKRALKKRVKVVIENTPNEDAPLEKLNIADLTTRHRYRKQAAMIGLAISMGATSLLVTRQSDQAQAAEPVGNQNTTSASSVDNTEVKLAVRKKLDPKVFTSVKAVESPSPIILEPTAVSQVPGFGAKWKVATSGAGLKNTVPVLAVDGVNTTSDANVKGERIVSAIAKVQSDGQQVVAGDSVNLQLKSKQELAINSLKDKSDRLRASLAELRSEETQEISQTTKINPTAGNQQPPIIGANNIDLLPEQQKNIIESQVSATTVSKVYEVKSGDTLAAIASNYGTSVSELAKANNLTNPNQLKISQKLNVPVEQKDTSTAASTTDLVKQLKQNRDATNNIAAITVPTTPADVSLNGIGGDTPVPKVFAEMQEATKRGARNKDLKDDPGLRSLQAEIEQLRQKYRNQQSGNSSGKVVQQSTPKNAVIPVPRYQRNTVSVPTVPTNTRNNNFSVPIKVPTPMAPTYTSQPTNPDWTPSRDPRSVSIPVPTGVDAAETLGNMRGKTVSPELPPLAAVDRYLPRAVDGNISPSDNPGGVYTPGIVSNYIWPAKGVLTSGFGMRWGRPHKGIDVANSTGTPVYASAPGVIDKAGWTKGGYGNLVEVRHPDGSMTRYGHNSKVLVRPGQQVQQGETIALMGSTGFSTGPHTHFEIHPSGKSAVNPIALLPKRI
jgi:murein DD-endopeptidase MepM/ murein hydrolase activator NlpD